MLFVGTVLDKLSLFASVHSLTVCAHDTAVVVNFGNMTVFDLLPSAAELARAKKDRDMLVDPFDMFVKAQLTAGDDDDDDEDEDDEVEDEEEWREGVWHLVDVVPVPELVASIAQAPSYDIDRKVCVTCI